MKKLFVGATVVAALGFATSANAADLGAKAPIYTKAPIAAAAFNWQRCYVGGQIGYGWGQSNFAAGSTVNTSGVVGGIQGGCNWLVAPSVLVGIEGDFLWSGMTGGAVFLDPQNTQVVGATANMTSSNRWDGDLAVRLGMPIDKALLYVKGGAAVARFDYKWDGFVPWTANQTRFGWIVGAGVEYAVTHNWTAKLEYNYLDFGTATLTTSSGATITPNEKKHLVKVGVNYLFGGPVVAKY